MYVCKYCFHSNCSLNENILMEKFKVASVTYARDIDYTNMVNLALYVSDDL